MKKSYLFILFTFIIIISSCIWAEAETERDVNKKVQEIVTEVIKSGMSDYDKALALHDWIIDHADYDDSLTKSEPVDLLFDGLGTCNAYMGTYKLLLDAVGIANINSFGDDHGWNRVKMGGKWYHVDCTWDDTSGLRHFYFGLSDYAIKSVPSHQDYGDSGFNEKYKCTSYALNYYYKNGLLTNTLNDAKNAIQDHLEQGEDEFTLSSLDLTDSYGIMTRTVCLILRDFEYKIYENKVDLLIEFNFDDYLIHVKKDKTKFEDIIINDINFPDEKFRACVNKVDKNKDGKLQKKEIENVDDWDLMDKGISSLTGIEYFTSLELLDCSDNKLTVLDLSGNLNLTGMSCANNQITQLNVSRNKRLENLGCYNNKLKSLDVSNNTSLRILNCSDNPLTTIDISQNKSLEFLSIDHCNFTSFTVNNQSVQELHCIETHMTSLDITNAPSLTDLYCTGNELTALDLSQNKNLELIACSYNYIESLKINSPKLKTLFCFNNCLQNLDVTVASSLETLWCHFNRLKILDLSHNSKLKDLNCGNNDLTWLDLSKNTLLNANTVTSGGCTREVVTKKGVFDISILEGFNIKKASNWSGATISGTKVKPNSSTVTYDYDCGRGIKTTYTLLVYEKTKQSDGTKSAAKIDEKHFPDPVFRNYIKTYFDLDENGNLSSGEVNRIETLNVSHMGIEDLKGVEYLTSITEIDCSYNQIEKLDLSKNKRLIRITCNNNKINSISFPKENKINTLECSSNRLTTIDLKILTSMRNFYCGDNLLTTLDLSKNTQLEYVGCASNKLTSLKTDKLTKLLSITCHKNFLTELNVKNSTNLQTLWCQENRISELDLSNNQDLAYLNCGYNCLTHLDLSKNKKLKSFSCDFCVREIVQDENTFDLSDLPGFDLSKAIKWKGGSVKGKILKYTKEKVTYKYKCGNGNTAEFTLHFIETEKIDITSAKLQFTKAPYTGKAIEPKVVVKAKQNGKTKTLKSGVDYKVEYTDNINAGKASVTIKGIGKYKGILKKSFSITPIKMTSAIISKTKMTYTGSPFEPSVTVKRKNTVLIKDTDYTVVYKNNINAGTAKVIVKGKGNYTGTITKTFTIAPVKILKVSLSDYSLPYTGKERKPIPTVTTKVNGVLVTLTKGQDYTVKYENNVDVGTATVTIKGTGNYSGTITKSFKIVQDEK